MPKLTKHERYNILIEEFNKREDKILDIYDEQLKLRLQNKSPKTIQRYFQEFMNEYNSIVEVPQCRKKTYKLVNPTDLIIETLEHFDDIGWTVQMLHDSDPKVFTELEKYTKNDKHIYQFISNPFEDTKSLEEKETFKHLKDAVSRREYRKITFQSSTQDNLKCLKLIYMENNWYIAYINDIDKLQFGRISHISKVEYASNIGSFQPKSIEKHVTFLKNDLQNSMTLYGKDKKIARIQVKGTKAKYFDEGMKLQMPSQKFEKKLDDGSIIFTVNYTQSLEILPFLYKWLPHLKILEPEELKKVYTQNLRKALEE